MDVNLLSKDMELNFSNKNEDEDELEVKNNGQLEKDQEDFTEDDSKTERFEQKEEQKDLKIGMKDSQLIGRPSAERQRFQFIQDNDSELMPQKQDSKKIQSKPMQQLNAIRMEEYWIKFNYHHKPNFYLKRNRIICINTLPFEAMSVDQVAATIESASIESHLHEVYNAIASSGTVNDKINVNKLSFYGTSPQTNEKRQKVAESGLAVLLCEVQKDKSEKVRRKAVASLGEFLFYAATQLDDDQVEAVWEIPIQILVKSLNVNEDETVRFYACKTIENITAQSISVGCNFATLKVATLLLNIIKAKVIIKIEEKYVNYQQQLTLLKYLKWNKKMMCKLIMPH